VTNPSETLAPVIQANVDWFLALLDGAALDQGDYEARFAPSFLGQVSAARFRQIAEEIGATGDLWRVVAVEQAAPSGAVVRIAPGAGEPAFFLSLSIDSDDRVDSLLVQPAEAPALDDSPATVTEAAARLEALGTLGYVVADTAGGNCSALTGQTPERLMPLGSMFKLYVLGAVVDAVEAGTISWDQAVEVSDTHRSLPSGVVQADPAGSTRTVRDLAELMISISDNTAADHLIAQVGRTAVEQAQRDYGHDTPEVNQPFLDTRELFILKLDGLTEPGVPGPAGRKYLAADEEGRRSVLEDLAGSAVETLNLAGWTQPIAIEGIEWFASPLDLCRVLLLLHEDPEASRILAINPGIPDTDGRWSYIGFKGGSEPGVLGLAWILDSAEGARRVVAGTVWNPDTVFDEMEASLLFGAIRDLSG
jgi:hypothetical protein